jgi:hypothetical protein
MNILQDKHNSLLKKLGTYIKEQRVKVFQENTEQFSQRIQPFSANPLSSDDIRRMELGDGSLPLSSWLSAWQLMQVSDKIVEASKSDTALFLASAERMNLTEADIQKLTPK